MKLNLFNRIEDGPRRTAAQAVAVVVFDGGDGLGLGALL